MLVLEDIVNTLNDMAFSINKATLVGNVTKDPEIKYTQSGKAVCSIDIATNRSVKKNDGYVDVPTFHRAIVWEKLAEFIAKTLVKGDKVYVDGRIDHREYENKQGQKVRVTEIIAESVIPMKKQGQGPKKEEKKNDDMADFPDKDSAPKEDVDPDDIPF